MHFYQNLVTYLRHDALFKVNAMGKVSDLLKRKPFETYTVSPETITLDALRLMSDKNIGALPVVDQQKLVGMFSERDYARKVVLQGRSSLDTRVGDIMSRDIEVAHPGHTIEHCMTIMSQKHLRHFPVIDNGKLVGIISVGDVVKYIIEEQESFIQHLQLYMAGA